MFWNLISLESMFESSKGNHTTSKLWGISDHVSNPPFLWNLAWLAIDSLGVCHHLALVVVGNVKHGKTFLVNAG